MGAIIDSSTARNDNLAMNPSQLSLVGPIDPEINKLKLLGTTNSLNANKKDSKAMRRLNSIIKK